MIRILIDLNNRFNIMLLGVNSSLENSVVTSLTQAGGLTASQILQSIHSRGSKASVQGIYKILTKLQQEGIINKQGTTYSLKLPWVLDLVELVEQMQEVYFKKDYFLQIIPISYTEKKRWHFKNLIKLIDFWIDIQLALITHTKSELIYSSVPHAWYGLTHSKQWSHFQKLLNSRIKHQFTVIGNKTYLDQYLNALLKDPTNHTTHVLDNKDYFEKTNKIYTTVIGDYIISLKLSTEATTRIDNLFNQITDEDDMYTLDILDTFTKSVRSSIQIKKDPTAAKKYRNRFTKIFGPSRLYLEN